MNKQEKIDRIDQLKVTENKDNLLGEILQLVEDEDLTIKLSAIEMLSSFNTSSNVKNILIQLTTHAEIEVRMYAIESLSYFSGEDVGDAIVARLHDSVSLVRITAAEVLGYIGYKKAVPYLCNALSDKNELVRAYAAEALGKLGDTSLISILKNQLQVENRNAARLGFYIGLFLLGEKHFLDSILEMLKCKSYRVRSAVANSLVTLVNEENFHKIKDSLEKAYRKEKVIAVSSSLQAALSELNMWE
ncbi:MULTISPECIES: HEAT repeat domain-containing protein [Paenibacillus]|uniref:HEAT repeat domain-containing protein n=1 Tax=Paenibacillus TaxID=44249 RepID=UPI001643710B|nr:MULTISPECIES: HEAT repeat domain-containing protein [Paenibacillus]MBJ9992380.1 HEAT repeat domain-containing protein [Paenibacillus sp. S28]